VNPKRQEEVMDGNKPEVTSTQGESAKNGRGERRRRSEAAAEVRYFLPKPGTSADKPELGREMANEAEALVEAFRKDQPVFTVGVWKAVTENEDGVPRIVREAVKRT
jgi:hypothetical protein